LLLFADNDFKGYAANESWHQSLPHVTDLPGVCLHCFAFEARSSPGDWSIGAYGIQPARTGIGQCIPFYFPLELSSMLLCFLGNSWKQ
jgi:hypothetical protein